jgi:Fuc2NAc and GlcNAc transferase
MRNVGWGAVIALVSWLAVGAFRRYALSHGVLDVPNERSSHAAPTPRVGGAGALVAIAIGLTLVEPIIWSGRTGVAMLAVVPTAIVGWLDDHGHVLPVRSRFLAHMASGFLILPLAVQGLASPAVVVLAALAWLLATVSAINVINFMDGIDGLIGAQTAIFGAHLMLLSHGGGITWGVGLSLAAAMLGFLVWNWAPARVFLGDVGSGSLAVLGLIGGVLAWQLRVVPFVGVFLPLLPIFLDASVTIARRARRGEQVTAAHRQHLYQRLANDARLGHATVSSLYGIAAALGSVVVLVVTTRPRAGYAAYAAAILGAGVIAEGLIRRRTGGIQMAPVGTPERQERGEAG